MKFVNGAWKILLAVSIVALMSACQTNQPEDTTSDDNTSVTKSSDKQTYNVVAGDHLWGIASKSRIYGNPYQWPLLYKANSDKIEDADLIHPGQSLTVARGMSSSAIDAAVRHAKSRGAWSIGVTEDSDRAYLSE